MQPELLALGAVVLLLILALLVWNTWSLATLVRGATARLSVLEQGPQPPARSVDAPSQSAQAAELAEEREELVRAHEQLSDELRRTRLEGQENRQLYLLMRGLLDRHELLRAARIDATHLSPREIPHRFATPPEKARSKAGGPGAKSTTTQDLGPFADDKEHQIAARMARVMVADLFLYNPRASEDGLSEEELRSRLQVSYRAARETFESRVADRVREERDYLDIAFERALKSRTGHDEARGGAEKPAQEAQGPVDDDDEHHRAARLARLMIADLFLDNWDLVETGVREGNLRELLEPACEEARRRFESHIAEHVWSETQYFDVQFEQVLWESQGHLLDSEFDRALRERLERSGSHEAAGS